MVEGDLDSQHPIPKLPIFSLPRPKPPEPPGLLTPPLHPGVAVPFQWEEVPGRPRSCLPRSPYLPPAVASGVKRCLDLPPRLLHDKQSAGTTTTNHVTIPSPTTVLEGPYLGHRKKLANTWSFRRGGSLERMPFGSTRWAGFSFGLGSDIPFHERKEVGGGGHKCGSGISLSEFFRCDCDQDETGDGDTKVKITRIRRRRSFLSLSTKDSHLWGSIYEGLKQVVSWRRRPTPTPTPEANRNCRSRQ